MSDLELNNTSVTPNEAAEQIKLKHDVVSLAKQIQEISIKADKKLDSYDQEKIEKMADACMDANKALQDIDLRIKQLEKENESLIKQNDRLKVFNDKGMTDELKKAHSEMTRYLKTGNPPSDKTTEIVSKFLCENENLEHMEQSDVQDVVKTLSAGVNPQGGYWVIPDRSTRSIDRNFETSPIRAFATVETVFSDRMEFIIDDNEAGTGGWVGEQSPARGETGTPNIGVKTIHVHEQYAQPAATPKLLESTGFNVEQWLQRKVDDRLTRDENTAFVTGVGPLRPEGYTTLPAWTVNTSTNGDVKGVYERGAIEQIESGTDGQITFDGINAMFGALQGIYQPSAVWMCSRTAFIQLSQLTDGIGRRLLDPAGLSGSPMMQLLGKPVIFSDDMPIPATDSLTLAYGDFGVGYTVIEKPGTRVVVDIYSDKRFIFYYVSKSVGAGVTNFEAIKLLKLSAPVGP